MDLCSVGPNELPGPCLDIHLKVLKVLRVALQPLTTQYVTGTSLSHASTILVQQDFGKFYTLGEADIIFWCRSGSWSVLLLFTWMSPYHLLLIYLQTLQCNAMSPLPLLSQNGDTFPLGVLLGALDSSREPHAPHVISPSHRQAHTSRSKTHFQPNRLK